MMPSKQRTARVEAPTRGAERAAIDLTAELLRRGQGIELTVGGRSMWPLVRTGDRLRIEPGLRPRLGDLAAVLRRGHLVVHRVVSLRAGLVGLKGDNLEPADAEVAGEQILGVVTLQRLRAGFVVDHVNGLGRVLDRAALGLGHVSKRPWRWLRTLGALRRIRG